MEKNLNDHFRRAFIDDLPSRLQELDERIRTLGQMAQSREALSDIFLELHSIKGSSSTFGLPILSSICHPFEDLVQEVSGKERIDPVFVELALEYSALLAETVQQIAGGGEDFRNAEIKLMHLHDRAFRRQFSMAIAVNSRMLRDVCREMGKALGARVIEFDDSLSALQRLLAEPFHVAVVSSELYPIQGESLVAALKLSRRNETGLKAVMISSNKEKAGYTKRDIDPDHIVLRDADFLANMQRLLENLHEHYQKIEKVT